MSLLREWTLAAIGLGLSLAPAVVGPSLALEPLRLGGASLSLAGEASGSLATHDAGAFNEADYGGGYGSNLLRLASFSLLGRFAAGSHMAVLAELRSDNLNRPRFRALYLRYRPWRHRGLDVQAGRIPPVFGAHARRHYGAGNPLIGQPLAYQYLTTLRSGSERGAYAEPEAEPGRGSYHAEEPVAGEPGLPLVNGLRWDTGVEVRIATRAIEASAALTQGSLSDPRVRDNNDGKQASARFAWRPALGFVLAASGARGAYRDEAELAGLACAPEPSLQRAWGLDTEYARGHWLLRGEAVWSGWDAPASCSVPRESPLSALATMLEGRHKLTPRSYVAVRVDRLGFNRVPGAAEPWEPSVSRVEVGLGYSFRRNVLAKLAYQHNWRDGGAVRRDGLLAAQLLIWF